MNLEEKEVMIPEMYIVTIISSMHLHRIIKIKIILYECVFGKHIFFNATNMLCACSTFLSISGKHVFNSYKATSRTQYMSWFFNLHVNCVIIKHFDSVHMLKFIELLYQLFREIEHNGGDLWKIIRTSCKYKWCIVHYL